jgi:hypothetical protein
MPRKILCLAIASLACMPALRVAAAAPDDRAVAQQIAQDLKDSGQLRDYRVGVKFQNGVAWLMGNVTNQEQRATAEQLALQSAGVTRVINKLEVTGASTESVQQAGGLSSEEYAVQPAVQPMARPAMPMQARPAGNMPVPYARVGQNGVQQANFPGATMSAMPAGGGGGYAPGGYAPGGSAQPVVYDNAQMPGYAWPSYAAYPNYAAVTYPQQYSPSAWPYIGPFYPYPQVPLGWRKVTLEWDDGWWNLDFKDCKDCY